MEPYEAVTRIEDVPSLTILIPVYEEALEYDFKPDKLSKFSYFGLKVRKLTYVQMNFNILSLSILMSG